MLNLFPKVTTPYYIYAPSWTHKSSGVRVLHLLCHALNESGHKAFLWPDNGNLYAVNPHLNTPLLCNKPEFQNFYNNTEIGFIAVYPDIVRGNPLNAKKVVRYLLAPAGAYGGDATFPATDKVYGYCSHIHTPTLCLPTFDPIIFYDTYQYRQGTCFYSHKYEMHGNQLLPITQHSARICGTPEEVAGMLQKAKVCYVYEMSEIIVLARMCGCPVEIVQTPYFSKTPDNWDFDSLNLKAWMMRFELQLEQFIKDTQEWK